MGVLRDVKEAVPIILLSTLLSSFGGLFLEPRIEKLVRIYPLLLIIPPLNDMMGDFGMILSSKITTSLFLGRKDFRKIFFDILGACFFSGLLLIILSGIWEFGISLTIKLWISVLLSSLIGVVSVGVFCLKVGMVSMEKGINPDNILPPLATGLADLLSMLLYSLFILLLI